MKKLQNGEALSGYIEVISREFDWIQSGGLCYEGIVIVALALRPSLPESSSKAVDLI